MASFLRGIDEKEVHYLETSLRTMASTSHLFLIEGALRLDVSYLVGAFSSRSTLLSGPHIENDLAQNIPTGERERH